MTKIIDGFIHRAMLDGGFPVLVSLARHDIDLAKAAVAAGAFGIKMHLNAYHRASGSTFGTFEEELPFIEQLAKLGKPLLVMSGQEKQPSPAELERLAGFGFEGFNLYFKDAQPHLFRSRLRPILALDSDSTDAEIDTIAAIPGAMIEASVTRFADYGKPLDGADLDRYAAIVARSGLPVLAPSQKRFIADDMARLKGAGVRAVIIGAIVTGSTPSTLSAALPSIVRAAEGLRQRTVG